VQYQDGETLSFLLNRQPCHVFGILMLYSLCLWMSLWWLVNV